MYVYPKIIIIIIIIIITTRRRKKERKKFDYTVVNGKLFCTFEVL